MQTAEALRRRIDAAEDLQSVVRTMKALAAVGIRRYEDAAASLSEYDRTVRLGLRIVLQGAVGPHDPAAAAGADHSGAGAADGPGLLVAFGSDLGMCGQLNDRVAQRAERLAPAGGERAGHAREPAGSGSTARAAAPDTPNAPNAPDAPDALVVGDRLAGILARTHLAPADRFRTPDAMDDVAPAAARLLGAIEERRTDRPELPVRLVFPRRTSAAGYEVRVRRVLPLDRRWLAALADEPWPTRCIPDWPGDRAPHLRAFIREYLFVALCRALVDALASEHAARLASMQSAERSVAERLDELRGRHRRRRQAAITGELMDVVSGFEALGRDAESGTSEAGDAEAAT